MTVGPVRALVRRSSSAAVAVLLLAAGARAQGRPAGAPSARAAIPDAAAPVAGGPTGARAMTLPQALAYARAHQPALRAALARARQAAVQAKVPSAQWLPQFGATAQILGGTANNTSALYLPVPVLDIPRIGGTASSPTGTWRPYASTYVGAGIGQEVFDFGRIAAQRAADDALADVQAQAATVTLLDVDFGVEEAYFAVWAAKAVRTASEEAYVRARAHRDLARAGVGSGLRSPIEGTRAEAVLARFETGRIRARGGVAIAESVFAASIGAPDAAMDVAGEPAMEAEMPALAVAMRRAAEHDPRIRQALAQLKAQDERTRAIGAELRPDLQATATISGRAGGAPTSGGGLRPAGDGLLPDVPNWDVGVVLSWPIFDGTVMARRNASEAMRDVRREELELAREQEVAAIEQSYVTFDVARMTLGGLEQAVVAARANYEQADARFRANLGTAVELADAEDLRASAEINLALGQFDLARARAAFGRAIVLSLWGDGGR